MLEIKYVLPDSYYEVEYYDLVLHYSEQKQHYLMFRMQYVFLK